MSSFPPTIPKFPAIPRVNVQFPFSSALCCNQFPGRFDLLIRLKFHQHIHIK